jgi:hypothetical protein
MRRLIRAGASVLALSVGFLGFVYWTMTRPPLEFAGYWARIPGWASEWVPFQALWTRARAGDLEVGDAAPDFELDYHDHSGKMRLSELRGRPVVLVFGSYT